MAGWVKLHRDIYDSDIWSDTATFRLFLLLIGKACHKDGIKLNGLELKKGQWVRSYRMLAKDLEYKEGRGFKAYSLSTIKRCVSKLIESERVAVQETEYGTLFTVLNYAKYQDFSGDEEETQNASQNVNRTLTELTQNNNKNARMQECKEIKPIVVVEPKENAFDFYQKNFGVLSPFLAEGIQHWLDDSGEDLVLEAMKLAIENNKQWKYAEAILKNWKKRNIKTLADVEAAKLAFERNKQSRTSNKKPVRTEKLPDWFDEEEKPKEPEKEELPVKHDDTYYKKLQLIEKMRKGGMWSEEKCDQELQKLNAMKTG